MALKYKVLVYQINNLSDARYCAGMGVEMLGFCIDPNNEKFLSPEKIKEIISWTSGSGLVLETGSIDDSTIQSIESVKPDYILFSDEDEYRKLKDLQIPLIQKIVISAHTGDISGIKLIDQAEYYLIESTNEELSEPLKDLIKTFSSDHQVILGFGINQDNVETVLDELKPSAIALKGGKEIRPGLKTFDELADILETLEILD